MPHRPGFLLAILLPVLLVCTAYTAFANSESDGIESLGAELLEGLGPKAPAGDASDPDQSAEEGGRVSRLPGQIDHGEDLGDRAGALSLARVKSDMTQAADVLAAGTTKSDLDRADAIQGEILSQLEELIARLSPKEGTSRSDPSPGGQQQAQSQSADAPTTAGESAAADSQTRLGQPAAEVVEKQDVQALATGLWGHLPERAREQMLQSFSEEFLPQYEAEIEQYYRQLSEEQNPPDKQ